MASIETSVENRIVILTDKITNWNELPTESNVNWVVSWARDAHAGYGIQCGGVIVLQCRIGERERGLAGPREIPGDLLIETDHVIRGMDYIAWRWTPTRDGSGRGRLEWQSSTPPAGSIAPMIERD